MARVGTHVLRRIKKFLDDNPDDLFSASQIAQHLNKAGSIIKEGLRFLHDFNLIGKTKQNANIFFFSINRHTRSGMLRQKKNEIAKRTLGEGVGVDDVEIEFKEVDESVNQDYVLEVSPEELLGISGVSGVSGVSDE